MELLTMQANSIQLELTQMFRHMVAVLPNLAPAFAELRRGEPRHSRAVAERRRASASLDGYPIGEAGEKIRERYPHPGPLPSDGRGGRLFTTCAVADSLLKAVTEAARNAASGGLVLVSLARSGFDRFQDYQESGQVLCRAVKSIGRGVKNGDPNIHGKSRVT